MHVMTETCVGIGPMVIELAMQVQEKKNMDKNFLIWPYSDFSTCIYTVYFIHILSCRT